MAASSRHRANDRAPKGQLWIERNCGAPYQAQARRPGDGAQQCRVRQADPVGPEGEDCHRSSKSGRWTS